MLGKKQMVWITQYRQKGIIFIVVLNERKISRIRFFKSRTCLGVLGKFLMDNSHSENSNPSKSPHGEFPPENSHPKKSHLEYSHPFY